MKLLKLKRLGRKLLSFLLMLALVLGLMPVMSLTAYATSYEDKTWSENQTITENAEIGKLTVTEDITVTIDEDVTVTVYYGIDATGHTLTVTGEGTLTVTGKVGDSSEDATDSTGGDGIIGNIVVNGANVTVSGGNSHWRVDACPGGNGVTGNVTVKSGSFNGTGGNGASSGTHNGGIGVYGNVIVEGGNAIMTGGTGGYGSIIDGSGGVGVDGNVTVIGGAASVIGGDTPNYRGGGSVGHAITGTITGSAEESTNNSTWIAVSGTTSDKRYVKVTRALAKYPLWVGGVQVTNANMDDVFGDGKVSYTPVTGDENPTPATLTLNGYENNIVYNWRPTYAGEDYSAAIYAEEDLTIELSGTNTVQNAGTTMHDYGILAVENLTIKGSGTLNAEGFDGINVGKNLKIEAGAVNAESTGDDGAGILSTDMIVAGGTVTAKAKYQGINSQKTISIKDGEVTATGEREGIYIASFGEMTIEGGEVIATGDNYFGINSTGSITIKEGAKVTCIGANSGIGANGYIKGKVINEIPGTGWTNTEGTQGKADIEVSGTGQDISSYKKIQFPSVSAATVTTAPKAKALTYTGTAQELVTAGTATGGTIKYAVTIENTAPADNLYTTSIPTATNAGAYYVWYKVVGDDSHADHIVDKPIVVTIAEAEVNPSAGETERSVKIEGIVKYSSGTHIPGAKVELMSGKDPIGKTVTTAEDGSYTFEEVLSDGIYNIKATITIGGQTRTITKLVTVKDAMIQEDANIVFPQENVNSELVVADDPESTVVSGIAVEGITDEAIRYASEAVDGRKVTVTLEAQGKKDLTNADEANLSDADKIIKTEQNNIKNAAKTDNGDQKTLDFLDFKILKTVTDTTTNAKVSEDRISETGGLIRIVIKYNFRGKDKLSLYRYHDGRVQEIGESNDSNSERIVIDTTAGTLTAYLKYFSTYAIGYTTADSSSPGQTTTSSSSSSGSSNGSTVTQTVKMDDIAEKYGITKDEMTLTKEVITGLTTDEDPKGSTYYKLLARVTKRAKNSLTLKWDYLPYADGYMVFGARCNTKNKEYKFELLETLDENDITGTRSFVHKDLKAKTYYKYMVVAYKKVGNQKLTVAASKVVHAPTKTAATTVAKKLKTSVSSVKLKVGGTKKLTATEVKEDKGKKLKRHRKLMYESENTAIATVTKKGGKIKAISKGSVDIYVYSANGTYKKIRVTVK